MSADQAFLDRIHRIETGRQWKPEGVVMRDRKAGVSKRRSGGGARNIVSFLFSLAAIAGIGWVLFHDQADLAGQFLAGDFDAMTETVTPAPAAAELPDV